MGNIYSQQWFNLFLRPIDEAQTRREAEFLYRQLPPDDFNFVLDLCCGAGRHARLLDEAGCRVVGFDANADALADARRASPASIAYVEGDMRDLSAFDEPFDAVVCLWQSFGAFDDATNADVLGQIQHVLRPLGRFVLDIYNPAFFRRRQGAREFLKDGVRVVETKTMNGDRLTVELDYGHDGARDVFEWRLHDAEELLDLAARVGFRRRLVCAEFNESRKPSPDIPRTQFVFEKPPLFE